MKVWQLYLIIGVLFFGIISTVAINYKLDKDIDASFQDLVVKNRHTEPIPQAETDTTNPDIQGAATTHCIPCEREKLEQNIATMSAQAVIVGNLETGEILASKNTSMLLPIASLTKIMTAIVALDNLALGSVVKVSQHCADTPKINHRLGLKAENYISIEDLIYGLLVRSGSDCACALGDALGGERELVALMNEKARKLNLTSTHFQNSVGNDAIDNFSSAKDTFKLAQIAMQNKVFRKIAGTNYFWGQPSTNQLLLKLSGITGIKTGYTPGAGQCLAASWVGKDGTEFLGIVLASNDRFREVGKLIDLSTMHQ
jgi:D-alanyl-D-alanine carboxypeptidase